MATGGDANNKVSVPEKFKRAFNFDTEFKKNILSQQNKVSETFNTYEAEFYGGGQRIYLQKIRIALNTLHSMIDKRADDNYLKWFEEHKDELSYSNISKTDAGREDYMEKLQVWFSQLNYAITCLNFRNSGVCYIKYKPVVVEESAN